MVTNTSGRFPYFSRRSFLLIAGKFVLLFVLLSRLVYLQVFRAREFFTQAEDNRIKIDVIPPPRGPILDRTGVALATNQNYYRVQFFREKSQNIQQIIARLTELLKLSAAQAEDIRQKMARARRGVPVILLEYLSWQDVTHIEGSRHELPGISISVAQTRLYPFGLCAAHVTGYISPINPDEITERHPLYFHPDFRIGRNGIEKTCNAVLQGKPGMRKLEVNAFGETIRELSATPAEIGTAQKLTIHSHLQQQIYEQLPDLGAGVVVLDVRNGDIVALTSTPSYDPNRFLQKLSAEYWGDLINNPFHPMINKPIANHYPPGSTFKVVVALAALEDGISPDMRVECTGGVYLGNHVFRCARHEGHGFLDLPRAIATSCNVYFYNLARKLGNEKIMDMARKLGLGQLYDIALPGEKIGFLPTRTWKKNVLHQEWTGGDTLNSGIGQGYVLTTPLQLAVVAARIASGRQVRPRILLPDDDAPTAEFPLLDIKPKNLAIVRRGMYMVVNEPGGTAFRSKVISPTMSMAGKTGTAQVVSRKTKLRIADHWSNTNHGLFISFGPYESPRYSCAVVAEHGGGGAKAAAPVAKRVFQVLDQIENPGRKFQPDAPPPETPPATVEPAPQEEPAVTLQQPEPNNDALIED